MAAFALVFNVNERRPRQFRDRINTLENFCDEELIERYRFPREGIEDIIDLVKEDVGPMCQRSHALDPTTKVYPQYRQSFLINSTFGMYL